MRPTRSGVALLLAGATSIAVGRVFGATEPYLVGAMALSAFLVSWLLLLVVRLKLLVARTVSPATVRSGAPIRVDLAVTNSRPVPTPILRIDDRIAQSPGPSIHIAPISGNRSAAVAYRIPAQQRGPIGLGPLTITTSDPFGLWRSSMGAGREVSVTVRPELIPLAPMGIHHGYDPNADERLSRSVASAGDEFYALRPYVVGDEIKRVNWRASARLDELIVRQDEKPKTGRTTLILDLGYGPYSDEGFERAVSMASSVLHSGTSSDQVIEFLTTDGVTNRRVSAPELDGIEEMLALIGRSPVSSVTRVLNTHLHHGQGGRLVLITGRLGADTIDSLSRAAASYEQVVPVLCEPPQPGDPAQALADLVLHDGLRDPRTSWAQAISDRIGAPR